LKNLELSTTSSKEDISTESVASSLLKKKSESLQQRSTNPDTISRENPLQIEDEAAISILGGGKINTAVIFGIIVEGGGLSII